MPSLLSKRWKVFHGLLSFSTTLCVIVLHTYLFSMAAAPRARHQCLPVTSIAKVLGHHPDCVQLIDGPTCTEATVRDGGCKDTRVRNFTSCGSVLYNEVEDPEPQQNATGLARTFSHCAYTSRSAGSPCAPLSPMVTTSATSAGGGGASDGSLAAGGPEDGSATPQSPSPSSPDGLPYFCGGGELQGMCVPGGAPGAEHAQCVEFVCEKGLCGMPVPTNEGGECASPGVTASSSRTACQRRVCRSGRCVVESLPDDTLCGPAGRCGEHICVAGTCVQSWEEDGVICGPSTACADQVCISGVCVEERRPDGRLCGTTLGGCPRMCAVGKCVDCRCGPAFAFWAGRQQVHGFQWTPFLTDLRENSFGGYFNLVAEELDIPPVKLPLEGPPAADRRAADSAIVVCSGCRLGMQLQTGSNMVQGGALLTGSVGLAVSPVRGGTYVSLDVVMYPNVTHHHLVVGWHPWASLSPPPLNTPHRWGDLSSPHPSPASAPGGTFGGREPGVIPRPSHHHTAWAFVLRRPTHWAFTTYEQVRSLFVGLHMTVASCSKAPSLVATTPPAAPPPPHMQPPGAGWRGPTGRTDHTQPDSKAAAATPQPAAAATTTTPPAAKAGSSAGLGPGGGCTGGRPTGDCGCSEPGSKPGAGQRKS